MKKFVSLFSIIFILSAVFISGCKKEEASQARISIAITQQDAQMEELARAMAKVLENQTNLEYLKTQISKTFDGDYDLLFAQLQYNILKASHIFTKSIQKNLSVSNEELLNQIPLLNIAVPYISEDVNVNTLPQSPWVIYVPENFQEGVTKYIVGFNARGERKRYSAVTPPSEAVVVIGQNERVQAVFRGKNLL